MAVDLSKWVCLTKNLFTGMLNVSCRFEHDSEAEASRHAALLGTHPDLGLDRVWAAARVEPREEHYDYIDTMQTRWEHIPAPGWCPCHRGETCPGELVRHEGEACDWQCVAHRWLLEEPAVAKPDALEVGGLGL